VAWIQQVEKPEVNIADLEASDKRWDDLDVALAEAILKVVNNSLLKQRFYITRILKRRNANLCMSEQLCGTFIFSMR
jgi:hypothetical protein